jgi:hypothetical protein
VTQTFHLEALGFSQSGTPVAIVQRQSVRAESADSLQRRAVRLLQRSRSPQWSLAPVEAVRIVDGAGTELFRWTLWDELGSTGRG